MTLIINCIHIVHTVQIDKIVNATKQYKDGQFLTDWPIEVSVISSLLFASVVTFAVTIYVEKEEEVGERASRKVEKGKISYYISWTCVIVYMRERERERER